MKTFYDEWLAASSEIQRELRLTPLVSRDRDIPWVETPQDAKVKLMVANGLGYATMGSNVLKAEIQVGWHTGKHRHGEESIHILSGEGFSVIDGERFDWHTGSSLHIPFWATHQHVNTGDVTVVYLSAMAWDLDRFLRVARIEQLENCGPSKAAALGAIPTSDGDYYADGNRAVIHIEDAPTDFEFEPQGQIAGLKNQHDFVQYLIVPKNGFRTRSVAITHQWTEPPYHQSGRHKHLEAIVYAVEGKGVTEMEGETVAWEAGDVLYVPPAMWEHEHVNDNPFPIKQLRIAFGIRQWITDVWPEGFTNQRIYDADGNPLEARPIERERERF